MYRVRNFRGRVSYFNQSEARKHCFLASDWLKCETLPRKFRTLFSRYLTNSLILKRVGTEFTRPYTVHEIDIESVGRSSTTNSDCSSHVNECPTELISMENEKFLL